MKRICEIADLVRKKLRVSMEPFKFVNSQISGFSKKKNLKNFETLVQKLTMSL